MSKKRLASERRRLKQLIVKTMID